MQKESDPKQPSKPEPLNLKDKDFLLAYFFKHCCNTAKFGDDEVPTADNATCPKVLMKGFQTFCNIVSNGTVSPSKFDKNVNYLKVLIDFLTSILYTLNWYILFFDYLFRCGKLE